MAAICSGPSCTRVAIAKGFCVTHYAQAARRGELSPISREFGDEELARRLESTKAFFARTFATRFWARVNKTETCWLWTGDRYKRETCAYGYLRRDGKRVAAHRISYELAHGAIPDGLKILHHCDVPLCVRPEHLFLGTQADNIHDAMRKGRLWHCKGKVA